MNIWIIYLWLAIATYQFVSFSKTCNTSSIYFKLRERFPLGLLFSQIKLFQSP